MACSSKMGERRRPGRALIATGAAVAATYYCMQTESSDPLFAVPQVQQSSPAARMVGDVAQKTGASALVEPAVFSAPSGSSPLPGIAALAFGMAVGERYMNGKMSRYGRFLPLRAEAVADAPAEEGTFQKLSGIFCNFFSLWLVIAAVAAIKAPSSFTWIPGSAFTGLLGLLMFSVGVTTTIDDFKNCMDRPLAVFINFISCYGIMPLLGFFLGKLLGFDGSLLAGLVLVGSINGGQASNLCTLIAGGDVALSVLMTTSTTLGCIFMTPLLCKSLLGAVVPIDALGIVRSTFEVVLAPIFLGVGMNTIAPKICKAVAPFTPSIGVIATILLVGASVAKCAQPIANAGLPLQFACLALHLFGGLLGYFLTKGAGFNEKTCRTVCIETAMKSSAFGFLLATKHFGAFGVRVPPAVSVVWMAITGSLMAVYWKGR